ncbi:MAG: hypothetical protein H0Z32_03915 [Bacillaceae bacterium]|nr:hypothetical protein [Bacillaceae bacterium]
MKKIFSSILFITILMGLAACESDRYFFSKREYVQDKVTYLEYKDYKNPLRISYEFWLENGTKNLWVTDEGEMKFVIRELKKSLPLATEKQKEELVDGVPRYVWFFLREHEKDPSRILLHVDVNEKGIAKIGGNLYVELTDDLWNYLQEVELRAENIPEEYVEMDK